MVRINLIDPKCLADQHLIAEYNEILMFMGYIKKYSNINLEKIPKEYLLGKGHVLFFKNKLKYLKRRHEKIRKEMKKRNFLARIKLNISSFRKDLKNDWKEKEKDKDIIKKRLIEKINLKPEYYRYYGKKINKRDLIKSIQEC